MDSSSEILITQICEIKYRWVIIHLHIVFISKNSAMTMLKKVQYAVCSL